MSSPRLPSHVDIREVGPRDGLQAESPLSPLQRATLVDALVACGVRTIEAASFVSPRAVPAMAGAAEVMAAIHRAPGVRYLALVPNLRGAELALAAGVDGLTFTVSASPAYNQRNVGMTIDGSLGALASVTAAAGPVPVDAVISCAFGSPYEGDIPPAAVAALVGRAVDAGAGAITLADTTGMATPRRIHEALDALDRPTGLHLHETRGTALVNGYAALEAGVTHFDTAVGGLGGSPFAAGAGGNLATEDLVHLLDDLDVSTGIDLDALLDVTRFLAELIGHAVASRVSAAGPRWRLAEA